MPGHPCIDRHGQISYADKSNQLDHKDNRTYDPSGVASDRKLDQEKNRISYDCLDDPDYIKTETHLRTSLSELLLL